jgi:enediyne biosynthesis protein E4
MRLCRALACAPMVHSIDSDRTSTKAFPIMETWPINFILALMITFGAGLHPRPPSTSAKSSCRFVEAQDRDGLHFQFHNSPTPNKYLIETMGGGVAILDYDNDGWPDIFFVNGAQLKNPQPDTEQPDKSAPQFWNRLFRNNHDGTFTDVTEKAGVKGQGYGMGVAVGDYDNDGFPDMFVTNYGQCILYHNNRDGTFTDVTAQSGIRTQGWNMSAGFLDYDNDGRLDLFVTRYLEWNFTVGTKKCGVNIPGGRAYCHPKEFPAIANYLFHNNGNGTFTDVSQESRIAASKGYGLGSAFGDFNNDGWMDIYVANDAFPQFLFKNNGNGTFTEIAAQSGVGYTEDGNTFSGMGTDFVDLDNDGWLDILTTALPYEYFALFHNNGDGSFAYESVTTNLAEISRPYGGWGIHVCDCDNDGSNELFVATSHVMDNIEVTQPNLHYLEKPLLLNYQDNKFIDVSAEAGEAFQQPWAARGAAFGDLFNNGHIDVVISDYEGPAHLLRNKSGDTNHWIELDLRGTKSNRDGVGARVKLTSGSGKVQYRSVSTAGSYASANDRRLEFGLGEESFVREISIRWPSGTVHRLYNPEIDHILRVVEPAQDPQSTGSGAGAATHHLVTFPEGVPASELRSGKYSLPEEPQAFEAARRLVENLCAGAVLRFPQDDSAEVFSRRPSYLRPPHGPLRLVNEASNESPYESGLALLRRGNLQEAVEDFESALRQNPDSVDAHYALGVALSRMGREHLPAAVDQFLEVLRLQPDHVDARVDLSSILTSEGDSAAAAAQLEEAIHIAPTNTDLYILLGKAQLDSNKATQATDSFKKALSLDSRLSAAHYGLGLAALKRHDNAQAIEEFNKAVGLNPDDAFSYLELGRIYLSAGSLQQATMHLTEAVRLRPTMAQAHFELGKLYQRQNASKAEGEYREALRLQPDLSEANYSLGQLLRSQGKNKEAGELLQKGQAEQRSRNSLGTANSLNADGIKEVDHGHLPDALAAFQKALAADPTFFMAAYNQGVVLGRLGKKQESIAAFRTAIRLRPDFVLGHYGLGLMLKAVGDPSASEELAKAQLLNKYVAQPLGRDVLLPDETNSN